MSPLLCSALLLSSTCLPPKKTPTSKPSLYVLQSKPTSDKQLSDVSLRNTRTGQLLWKRRVLDYQPSQVVWANNRRALLIDMHGGLLIWRAGKPLQETPYAGIPRPEGIDRYDYLMSAQWSPDARRLLVSFGMSGMGDMGYSRLFCMTFKGNRYNYTMLPSNSYVRDMGWRSNRVAFYRPAKGIGGQTTGKLRLWRVP